MGKIKPLNEVKAPEWARNMDIERYRKEGGTMTEAAKEARRAYKREWNKKNRDKVRESQRRYWERKAAAQDQEDAPGEEPPTIGEV